MASHEHKLKSTREQKEIDNRAIAQEKIALKNKADGLVAKLRQHGIIERAYLHASDLDGAGRCPVKPAHNVKEG